MITAVPPTTLRMAAAAMLPAGKPGGIADLRGLVGASVKTRLDTTNPEVSKPGTGLATRAAWRAAFSVDAVMVRAAGYEAGGMVRERWTSMPGWGWSNLRFGEAIVIVFAVTGSDSDTDTDTGSDSDTDTDTGSDSEAVTTSWPPAASTATPPSQDWCRGGLAALMTAKVTATTK